jgi:hypothetical protein
MKESIDLTTEEGGKTPQPLDEVGKETLLALMTSDTKTNAAIKLGIDRKTLYSRMEKYGLRAYLSQLQQEALDTLRMGSIKAAENMVNKIDHRDAKISMEASRDVLDRAGIGVKKESNTNVQVNIMNKLEEDKEKYNF